MRRGPALLCHVLVCSLLMCPSCGPSRVRDPLSDLRDPRLSQSQRAQAIRDSWAQVERGEIDRGIVREEIKTLAWSRGWPGELRLLALRTLLNDRDPASEKDSRALARLMLPTEPDHAVVAVLAGAAAERDWPETTPALVRSLSRYWPGTPDRSRPEYLALARLNPGKPVERVIYDIFLYPPEDEGAFTRNTERTRFDAWDLLGRVDADGSARAAMLLDDKAPAAGPVADMRASLLELRTLPVTGEELRWLVALHQLNDPAKQRWWKQVSIAVGGLESDRATRLQLRHLEPIRWASLSRPEWFRASRPELLAQLRSTLAGRKFHKRKANAQERWTPPSEQLRDWESKLTWADLITILVIDEGLHDPGLRTALFAQAGMDHEDTTAEYGGLIRATDRPTGPTAEAPPASSTPDIRHPTSDISQPPWLAVLYPPRPGNRRGDRDFVASSDMIAQGDHALAHYHFHAQDPHNSEYAGPSPGDLAYAARMGRTCIVFTSIEKDTLNADLYQPDGLVLDLGELRVPPGDPAGR